MDDQIKSGKEILDEFFDQVDKIPGVEKEIAALLKKLHARNKLTATNLSNALLELRAGASDG